MLGTALYQQDFEIARLAKLGFVSIRLTLIHHKIVVGSMVYIELAHEQANKTETELY